ncbi:unnamed protein product [Schistosoma rodhaini]|uniref:Uncharacterized protein n=1 Tax=Schistosoma rodhaini TaxID=6188 RepID=A0AA85ET77_9TREM|nr:unnamed protein product [Schistosoma rodhaini]
MTTEIATPLIAFGCALIVFLFFIFCLVSHHILCGHRKQPQTFPQLPPVYTNFYPASPHSMHIKEEPLQCMQEETQLKMDEQSTSKTDIGNLLKFRLQAAENDDDDNENNYKNNESPLEYAYEGSDEEPFQHVDLCSETNSNKNESQLSPVNNPPGFE